MFKNKLPIIGTGGEKIAKSKKENIGEVLSLTPAFSITGYVTLGKTIAQFSHQ